MEEMKNDDKIDLVDASAASSPVFFFDVDNCVSKLERPVPLRDVVFVFLL